MNPAALMPDALAVAPVACMAVAAVVARLSSPRTRACWSRLQAASALALLAAFADLVLRCWPPLAAALAPSALPGLLPTRFGAVMALLVQLLGSVIAAFSARYLQGEPGQPRHAASLATVLMAVQLLLLADHWLVLIAAWALVGIALQPLLCFYPQRAFALLAAHKKRLADRLADLLLLGAAALSWREVGNGSLSALWLHLAQHGADGALQLAAVLLAAAVMLRTALLPAHGWLIQVMEAPTPVSALLHAGVVNLGGYVLIRFAPLLALAPAARGLLVAGGLATACLAGLVMLTRVSIKVRLAWSTAAQMGFMVLECGLGLYPLAALHLVGHSLYKAHAFLSASGAVRETRLRELRGDAACQPWSLLAAPLLAAALVAGLQRLLPGTPWPWWWSGVLALAWAPLLWLPRAAGAASGRVRAWQFASGVLTLAALTLLAWFAHELPLGLPQTPRQLAGPIALGGLLALYLCLAALQWRAELLASWRHWIYAGFYVDEAYTRLALRLWPTRWVPAPAPRGAAGAATVSSR